MDTNAVGIFDQLRGFDPASSPLSLPAIVGIGLVCGLILWLFGKQVLKPIVAILGGAWGSALGILAPSWLGITMIGQVPASLVGLGVGALLGFLVGLALYRTLITLTTGLALGVVGLLAGLALLSGPLPAGEPTDPSALDPGVSAVESAPEGRAVSEPTAQVAQHAARFVRDSAKAVTDRFGTLSEDSRLKVLGATLGGLIFGLIAGLAAPGRASALVTAAFGSGLWLYCFAWLSLQQDAPWARSLTLGPGGWAVAWGLATVVGIAAQLFLWGKKPSARPAEAPAPA